jgi:uncharacterized membrane protein/thiol-disulfide isomerase/thioredoxin
MAFLTSFSNTTDENAITTLHALLKGLGAKVTKATVQEVLEQHPDFPSLLSLSDALTEWQVENTGLQLNTVEQLRELPFPFLAHLRKQGGWYVLVTALQGDTITYTDSTEGRRTESLTDFEKDWSGVVLLAETNEQSEEADYAPKRKQEFLSELRGLFVSGGIGMLVLFALLSVAKTLTAPDWLLLLSKSMGLALSALLVAKQLGSKNTLTDRLCRINSKTNCDDMLNSPGAKLWGWLNWTDVGLLYFAGGLLAVLAIGIQPAVRPLIDGLALLALPYTLFSVYYQGVVLKQWCPLCLGVQGVLLVEGVLATTQLVPLTGFIQPYLLTLTAFLLPTLLWIVLKPLLAHLPKSHREHDELMRLKRDPNLFRALLMQQPQMPPIPADLHPIVLGNPEAEHTITMVTNPYCGPCAKTHKELERLIERSDNVKVAIIFSGDGTDGPATRVASHLLAFAKQGNIAQALTDWYGQSEKNFESWAINYPIRFIGMAWEDIAHKHSDWCRKADIRLTPTICVNGYQLPEEYSISPLYWLINYLPISSSKTDLAKSP